MGEKPGFLPKEESPAILCAISQSTPGSPNRKGHIGPRVRISDFEKGSKKLKYLRTVEPLLTNFKAAGPH